MCECVCVFESDCVPSHLISQGGQVSLKALVFALKGLNAGQVVAIVVCVQRLVLLLDPLLGLIRIPEENKQPFSFSFHTSHFVQCVKY